MRLNKRFSSSRIYGGYWNATVCNLSKATLLAQPKNSGLRLAYARCIFQHGFEDRPKVAG